ILIGLAAAVVLRIGFALITVQLLAIIGLLLAGGFLLLWVCWKMWRELQEQRTHDQAEAEAELQTALSVHHGGGPAPEALGLKRKSFGAALVQIMIADITMSLDNVLAVAGAAHEHPWIMVFGLVLSIALMGVAATFIARILTKHRWIGYVGLFIVLYVALHMIWDGARSVIVRTDRMDAFNASAPGFLDISEKEKAKFLKGVRSEDTAAPATGLPSRPADPPPPARVDSPTP
ncbi:MAG: YjbE family putative metal transport protein, partial [Brevundimonas sp.]|uniref:YjbE family putative metal transport protein n=1 Tax=Brevundimonas sp. TaxID=1871086 RepID=UPI002735C819